MVWRERVIGWWTSIANTYPQRRHPVPIPVHPAPRQQHPTAREQPVQLLLQLPGQDPREQRAVRHATIAIAAVGVGSGCFRSGCCDRRLVFWGEGEASRVRVR